MAEYIDREAFLEHMKKTNRYFDVKFDIESFPTADVVPVVHGHFVHDGPRFAGGVTGGTVATAADCSLVWKHNLSIVRIVARRWTEVSDASSRNHSRFVS